LMGVPAVSSTVVVVCRNRPGVHAARGAGPWARRGRSGALHGENLAPDHGWGLEIGDSRLGIADCGRRKAEGGTGKAEWEKGGRRV
jgi:hypothetical protein